MPEAYRSRREPTISRETDFEGAGRQRPGFGPGDDPLAELARIVGETAPPQSPVAGQSRHSAERDDPSPPRDYPRRDTSWRDPQAQTTVRAGLRAQPMPGQLEDLEAELFSEIRSENLRNLPPAPDLAQLGLPDARLPQYAATSRSTTGNRPVAATPSAAAVGPERDDEMTLPMHAVLRAAPKAARASEDHRMQQPPRFNPAPLHEPAYDPDPGSADEAHYHDHADYDPAGALGDAYHDYDAAEAAYYADEASPSTHGAGQPMHPPMPGYEPASSHFPQSQHYEEDDDTYAAYQAPRVDRRPPPRRSNSLMLGAVAVVGVIVLGIGGLFTYRAIAGSGATGAYAPLIRADTKPMKEQVAQAPLAASGPNLDTSRPDGQDKLVTQAEDPVDQIPGKPNVRIVGPGTSNGQNPSLAPIQRVRSVIVRPDGSIVTPDDAPPKPLLVQTASLPTATTSDTSPSPMQSQTQTPTAPAQAAPAQPALPPLGAVTHVDTVPSATSQSSQPAAAPPRPPVGQAPAPLVKPAPRPVVARTPAPDEGNGPVSLDPSSGPARPAPVAPPVRVANTQPPTTPARAASSDAGTGEYMVQISSQRSDAEARHALAAAEQKYAALGASGGDVQQADLPGRGTYYRARLSAGTREQAAALCAQIKSQGGDCVVAKR